MVIAKKLLISSIIALLLFFCGFVFGHGSDNAHSRKVNSNNWTVSEERELQTYKVITYISLAPMFIGGAIGLKDDSKGLGLYIIIGQWLYGYFFYWIFSLLYKKIKPDYTQRGEPLPESKDNNSYS